MGYYKNILDSINLTNKIKLFKNKLELSQQNIAYLNSKIVNKFSYKLKTYINKLDYYENTININNPNYILGKGYLIANNLSGNQIQSIKSIQINENIKLQFKDGIVKSKILKIEENEK